MARSEGSLGAAEIDALLVEVEARMSHRQRAADTSLQRLENGCNPAVRTDIDRYHNEPGYAAEADARVVETAQAVLALARP